MKMRAKSRSTHGGQHCAVAAFNETVFRVFGSELEPNTVISFQADTSYETCQFMFNRLQIHLVSSDASSARSTALMERCNIA